MDKQFQNYILEDFLEDSKFCSWVCNPDAEQDANYKILFEKYPEKRPIFQKAVKIVSLLEEEKVASNPVRKLQIWENIRKEYRRQQRLKLVRQSLKYAALLLVALGIGTFMFLSRENRQTREFFSSTEIPTSGNTIIRLNSGEKLALPSDRSEIVYQPNGNTLTIDQKVIQQPAAINEESLNELVVPYGKQSKIILADQTEVWLNAGSRLLYPSRFEGKHRKVSLQGEAFFKVTKDPSKPFIVETSALKINVLGTSFNVKAYQDDKWQESVLVEGKISLELKQSILPKKLVMQPAQRIVVADKSSDYSLTNVDVSEYTSWINGLFSFQNEPIPSVLKRVSRFYNLNIAWDQSVEKITISGKLDLKEDYQRVLNTLSLISNGEFTSNNNIIYYSRNATNLKN